MLARKVSVLLLLVLMIAIALNYLYTKTTADRPAPSPYPEASETLHPDSLRVIADNVYQPYIDKVGAAFERKYGIKVEVLAAPADELYNEIVKRLDYAKTDIDLVQVDSVWTPEFAHAGYLEPLNNYVTEEIKSNTNPLAYEQRIVSNELYTLPELYAFPMSMEARFLFYNQDLLRKVGFYAPPSTWQELMDAVQFLRDKNLAEHGVLWAWQDADSLLDDFTLLLNARGGQFKDANGKWIFNQDKGLQALQFMVDSLHVNGLSDPLSTRLTEAKAAEEFAKGRVPFLIAGSFAAHKLRDYSNIKVALIPGFDRSLTSSTVAGGSGIGIVRTSKNKEWGWKFVEMMSATRSEIVVTDYTGALPVWNDMIDLATLKLRYPNIEMMKQQFEYAINQPRSASYHAWAQNLQSALRFALIQKNTPQDALNQAVWRVEKELIN